MEDVKINTKKEKNIIAILLFKIFMFFTTEKIIGLIYLMLAIISVSKTLRVGAIELEIIKIFGISDIVLFNTYILLSLLMLTNKVELNFFWFIVGISPLILRFTAITFLFFGDINHNTNYYQYFLDIFVIIFIVQRIFKRIAYEIYQLIK